jgi:2,3-diaminopropionate biosynthesis protein SbnA
MESGQELIERLAFTRKIIRETPVVPLADDRIDLYAKLEFLNGVGSVKDRPALWILERAIERGEVGPESTIIESSSGNFACALATFCRMLGLKFIPVVDPDVSPAYEGYLCAHCERVVKVRDCDDAGGFLKTRLRMVETLLTEIPDSYWPDQYKNPDGMAAHYHLTAGEICRALPQVDYVFLGVSTAGTVAGVSRRLKERDPSVRIVGVDTEGSVIFGQHSRKRHIPGIGSSISPPLLKAALIDEIVIVPERDTVLACHELLERHGLFVGGSTGTVYSAIQHHFPWPRGQVRPKVLFLCCDRGTAYLHNVFDRKWAALQTSKIQPDTRITTAPSMR